ncbi:MAG: hypothetical protein FWH27_05240 [Planctomycetaceae bacterium]|nr:hypothetical protein [Planctomycetaceae bacterium]
MKVTIAFSVISLFVGFYVNTIAQEGISWNFECDVPALPKEYDFLPRFPSKEVLESHTVDVDESFRAESVQVLKWLVNEKLLPADMEIEQHLIAVANPSPGKTPVVWGLNPFTLEMEPLREYFIVQWSKNNETFCVLDSNPMITFRISADTKGFDDPQQFVLDMFHHCLAKEFADFFPPKDKIIFFDEKKEGLLAGGLTLETKGGTAYYPAGCFGGSFSFYHYNGNFFIQTMKNHKFFQHMSSSRFEEGARLYNLVGGPERVWTEAEIEESLKPLRERERVVKEKTQKINEEIALLLKTLEGRVKLIGMIESAEGRETFEESSYEYNQFREMPFKALYEYYFMLPRQDDPRFGGVPVWEEERCTEAEATQIKKLLQSKDPAIKKYAMQLIEATSTRSLLPDLIEICSGKDQILNLQGSYAVPNDPNIKPRIYNFNVYRLIGIFGDEKTLKSLNEMQNNQDFSPEAKADILLAMDDIQRLIDMQERREQQRLEQRRLIREGKLMVMPGSPLLIDIDKPDPEPVSPEGFRNWETTDGLFKTTAKFLGIKGKDTQLERKDGRIVGIELDALRPLDQEYVKEQLAPK